MLGAIYGLTAISLVSGCGKSEQKSAEEKAIERHAQEVRQKEVRQQETRQKGKKPPVVDVSTLEASKYLAELLNSGKLPDIKDAGPRLEFRVNRYSTNYPMSRTFILKMKNGQFVNHYTVEKETADSFWQLKKDWRTDAQGNIVKEYPVN